jgi:ABC-2 type transport system permease protein
MWPLAIVGPALRTLGHLSPHAWAMDAALALSGGKAGLGAVRTELAVLGGFAVVLFMLSTARLRRVLA